MDPPYPFVQVRPPSWVSKIPEPEIQPFCPLNRTWVARIPFADAATLPTSAACVQVTPPSSVVAKRSTQVTAQVLPAAHPWSGVSKATSPNVVVLVVVGAAEFGGTADGLGGVLLLAG